MLWAKPQQVLSQPWDALPPVAVLPGFVRLTGLGALLSVLWDVMRTPLWLHWILICYCSAAVLLLSAASMPGSRQGAEGIA